MFKVSKEDVFEENREELQEMEALVRLERDEGLKVKRLSENLKGLQSKRFDVLAAWNSN